MAGTSRASSTMATFFVCGWRSGSVRMADLGGESVYGLDAGECNVD